MRIRGSENLRFWDLDPIGSSSGLLRFDPILPYRITYRYIAIPAHQNTNSGHTHDLPQQVRLSYARTTTTTHWKRNTSFLYDVCSTIVYFGWASKYRIRYHNVDLALLVGGTFHCPCHIPRRNQEPAIHDRSDLPF